MTPAEQATIEILRVNGQRLFTRSIGHGPEVVVLHGGPGAHHDYLLPQFDALAVGRRLHYYDQRGGGQSAVARDVSVEWQEHVRDLDGLIDHWDLVPATLLGYSWGGLLAILYSINHPDKVGRLALVSPASITVDERAEFERRFAARARDPQISTRRTELKESGLRQRDPAAYRQEAFELSVAPYFADAKRARDLTPFRVTGRTQQAVWQSLAAYDLRDDMAQLSIPAIVVHGRHDPIPLSSSELIASLLDAPLEVCEESGHVPYIENHERFVRVLDEFLPSSAR